MWPYLTSKTFQDTQHLMVYATATTRICDIWLSCCLGSPTGSQVSIGVLTLMQVEATIYITQIIHT